MFLRCIAPETKYLKKYIYLVFETLVVYFSIKKFLNVPQFSQICFTPLLRLFKMYIVKNYILPVRAPQDQWVRIFAMQQYFQWAVRGTNIFVIILILNNGNKLKTFFFVSEITLDRIILCILPCFS